MKVLDKLPLERYTNLSEFYLTKYFLLNALYYPGQKLVTKAVGKDAADEITDEYKFPEGSILERASVRNAMLKSRNVAIKAVTKGEFFFR